MPSSGRPRCSSWEWPARCTRTSRSATSWWPRTCTRSTAGTSQDDGFKSRPRVWETSHVADQIAQHLHRTGAWAGDLDPRPQVHFGPIAAGEVVLNSRLSEHAHWIREHYNDARAIEMEGAGVAQAGHLNRALPVVVIRGISDRADGTKEATDREQWQPRAVASAATFAAALAEELSAEGSTTRSSAMPETNRNIAKGKRARGSAGRHRARRRPDHS
ncbi:hypothetical protein GCM10020220_063950 [Nonomuraea rubra]